MGEDLEGTRCGAAAGEGSPGSRAASEEEAGSREDPCTRPLDHPVPALRWARDCRARPGKPAETPGWLLALLRDQSVAVVFELFVRAWLPFLAPRGVGIFFSHLVFKGQPVAGGIRIS